MHGVLESLGLVLCRAKHPDLPIGLTVVANVPSWVVTTDVHDTAQAMI